jgi:chromosome segregation ATPase
MTYEEAGEKIVRDLVGPLREKLAATERALAAAESSTREALAALSRVEAERDEARAKIRNLHHNMDDLHDKVDCEQSGDEVCGTCRRCLREMADDLCCRCGELRARAEKAESSLAEARRLAADVTRVWGDNDTMAGFVDAMTPIVQRARALAPPEPETKETTHG